MKKYKFKPDYKKIWLMKGLTKKQMLCLYFGVDPAKYERWENTPCDPKVDDERTRFADAIKSYINNDYFGDFFKVRDGIYNGLQSNLWNASNNNIKASFVRCAYTYGMYWEDYHNQIFRLGPHPDFIEFLKSIGEWYSDLDQYKARSYYEFNSSKWLKSLPKNEEEAISVVLGWEPEHFELLFKDPKDIDTNDEISRLRLTYMTVIRPKGLFETWQSDKNLCREITNSNYWKGDFLDFVQTLYDNGYVFKNHIDQFLEQAGFEFKYSSNAWPKKRYEDIYRLHPNVWPLSLAINLFIGSDPYENNKMVFMGGGLSISPRKFIKTILSEKSDPDWEQRDEQFGVGSNFMSIRREVLAAVNCGDLNEIKIDSKDIYFKSEDIIQWLNNYLPYSPPKILIDTLNLNIHTKDHLKKSDQATSEQKTENKITRKTPYHGDIGRAYKKILKNNMATPNAHEIKKHPNEYEHIIKFADDSKGNPMVHYKNSRGKEHSISRSRFDDIVSDFRTGKKSASDFLG